jgi:hypothetical protein
MEEDMNLGHSSADTLDGNHLTSQDSDSKPTRNHDFSGDTRSKKDTHLEERKIFKWSHLLASKTDNLGPQTRSAWYTWGPPESHPVPTVANPEIQKLFEKREPLSRLGMLVYKRRTGWDLLCRQRMEIEPAGPGLKITDYLNTCVRLHDLRAWEDFPTFDEILEFSRSTDGLRKNVHETMYLGHCEDETLFCRLFGCAASVNKGVKNLEHFFKDLVTLIRLASCNEGKEKLQLAIGPGCYATQRRIGGRPTKMDPDLVTFWRDFEQEQVATDVPCLMVGNYHLARQFNQQMLLRAITTLGHHAEVQKVINQIHDHMDMHHNRYGYVITETELVMFRRREKRWGLLDFSPSIPLHTADGRLNAIMVLWYFHVKYAVMTSGTEGYRLESLYHNCPKNLGGGIYPKGNVRPQPSKR